MIRKLVSVIKSNVKLNNNSWYRNSINKSLSCLCTSLIELPYRICISFIPPVFEFKYKPVVVDLLGPVLALLLMFQLLIYGHRSKHPDAVSTVTPAEMLLAYSIAMPCLTYILNRLVKSQMTFLEIVTLLGYGLFGHVFTIITSLLVYEDDDNFYFFVCFFMFGGLSALRIALVILFSIRVPIARLLVCSLVSTLHLLFLIATHFSYVHKTFVYGNADIVGGQQQQY